MCVVALCVPNRGLPQDMSRKPDPEEERRAFRHLIRKTPRDSLSQIVQELNPHSEQFRTIWNVVPDDVKRLSADDLLKGTASYVNRSDLGKYASQFYPANVFPYILHRVPGYQANGDDRSADILVDVEPPDLQSASIIEPPVQLFPTSSQIQSLVEDVVGPSSTPPISRKRKRASFDDTPNTKQRKRSRLQSIVARITPVQSDSPLTSTPRQIVKGKRRLVGRPNVSPVRATPQMPQLTRQTNATPKPPVVMPQLSMVQPLMTPVAVTTRLPAPGANVRYSSQPRARRLTPSEMAMRYHNRRRGQKRIVGLSKPAVRRLARRAGVRRLSGGVYQETSRALRSFLYDILKQSIVYCEYANRKTVTVNDVQMAAKNLGTPLYM